MNSRKRRHSLTVQTMFDQTKGPYAQLNGTWFVKKIENEDVVFMQTQGNKFEEITPQCFEVTMQNSKTLPVEEIKKSLEKFKEATNAL